MGVDVYVWMCVDVCGCVGMGVDGCGLCEDVEKEWEGCGREGKDEGETGGDRLGRIICCAG
jgi:hypothetical protein